MRAMLRILPMNRSKWPGFGEKYIGHLKWGKNMLRKAGVDHTSFDRSHELNLTQGFIVDLESFTSGLPKSNSVVDAYTDGSKLCGKAGYGFGVTKGPEVILSGNGYLGLENSVFQAEILAIQKAAEALMETHFDSVHFFSDSQAAIAALTNLKLKHSTVAKCIECLNILSERMKVTISWVKAHADHPGNEYADMEAKSGTTNVSNTVETPTPLSWANSKIANFYHKMWQDRWAGLPFANQTKIWFPKLDKTNSKELLKLSRLDLGLCTQFITGHNRLKKHEAKVTAGTENTCRLCLEDIESSWHVVGECPALWQERRHSFKISGGQTTLENPPKWKVYQLMSFLNKTEMTKLNSGQDAL